MGMSRRWGQAARWVAYAAAAAVGVSCGDDSAPPPEVVEQTTLKLEGFCDVEYPFASAGSPAVVSFGGEEPIVRAFEVYPIVASSRHSGAAKAELSWTQDGQDFRCAYERAEGTGDLVLTGCLPYAVTWAESEEVTLTLVFGPIGISVDTKVAWGAQPTCAGSGGEDACAPVAAGTACVDSNVCDGAGECTAAGRCVEKTDGTPIVVTPDSDPCTFDYCHPIEGAVSFSCPALDTTVSTHVGRDYDFLYDGEVGIQTDLDPESLDAARTSIVRGKLVDSSGTGVPGVTVTALERDPQEPDLGRTTSMADGEFQLVVHGGREVAVRFDHPDYIQVSRKKRILRNDIRHIGTIVLTERDTPTSVALGGASAMVTQSTSINNDGRGERRAYVYFPPNTDAFVVEHPDDATGDGVPLPSPIDFSISEYTQGANGLEAMPGDLPPSSGYTYAIELGVEGVPADKHVKFNQPVVAYVHDLSFLGFPAGTNVPVGWLSRTSGDWEADAGGMVIQIATEVGSTVTVTPAMTLTADEQSALAANFAPGDVLWRFEMTHLTSYDVNWGIFPPLSAIFPWLEPKAKIIVDDPSCRTGSEIECESQVLGEALPLIGSPLSLHYRSDRVVGRKSRVEVPLWDTVPADVKRVDVTISVAGQQFVHEIVPPFSPDQSVASTWDHKDFLGRPMQGAQQAVVDVGYWYDATYAETVVFAGPPGTAIGGSPDDGEIRQSQSFTIPLGNLTNEAFELGGWNIGQHHFYDANARRLYFGDGSRQTLDAESGGVIRTTNGDAGPGFCVVPGAGQDINFDFPRAIAVGPDDAIWIAEGSGQCNAVWRRDLDGTVTQVATFGNSVAEYIVALAVGPDGTAYVGRGSGGTPVRLVERIDPMTGEIIHVAGSGTACAGSSSQCGDGGPATAADIGNIISLAVGPDGALYIGETGRIRRVDAGGTIDSVAGGPGSPSLPSGAPRQLVISEAGSIFFSSGNRVHVLTKSATTTDGLYLVAGKSSGGISFEEGIPASELSNLQLGNTRGLALAPDGRLIISTSTALYAVQPPLVDPTTTGPITTLAGNYGPLNCTNYENCAQDRRATQASLINLGASGLTSQGIAVNSRSEVHFIEGLQHIGTVTPALPTFGTDTFPVPSADGALLFVFDGGGRHLSTLDATTGVTLLTFGYDSLGRLNLVTDLNGRSTTISRSAGTGAISFQGPFGTTVMTRDANGYADTITTPGGTRQWDLTHDADGLLTSMVTPENHTYDFTYDADGLLLTDDDPAGGNQTLAQTSAAGASIKSVQVTQDHGGAAPGTAVTTYENGIVGGSLRDRIITLPTAHEVKVTEYADGAFERVDPDGTTTSVFREPDPRPEFGVHAQLGTSTVTSGSGTNETFAKSSMSRTVSGGTSLFPDVITQTLSVYLSPTTTADHVVTYTRASNTGTVVSQTDVGRTTTTTLDALGRPTKIAVPGFHDVDIEYYTSGANVGFVKSIKQGQVGVDQRVVDFDMSLTSPRWSQVSNPLAHVTKTNFNSDWLPSTVDLPQTGTATGIESVGLGFDLNGNLNAVTPPSQPTHSLTYTPVDLLQTYDAPNVSTQNGLFSWSHTDDRQLDLFSSPNGMSEDVEAFYDQYGRLIELDVTGDEITFGYDQNSVNHAGKLDRISRPGHNTELNFAFDQGLLTSQTLEENTGTAEVEGTISYTYQTGFLPGTETISGESLGYVFDNDRLLDEITDGSSVIVDYGNHASHGLLQYIDVGSVSDDYMYSPFGELSDQIAVHTAHMLYDVVYTRDDLGRVACREESIWDDSGASTTYTKYEYWERGWLKKVEVGGNCTPGTGGTIRNYTYDANGNYTNAVTDARDRITSYDGATYVYDNAGRLTSRTEGTDVRTYGYSPHGELTSVTVTQPSSATVEYILDPLGRRVGKVVNSTLERGWLYGNHLGPDAELAADGVTVTKRFIYGTRSWVPDAMIHYDGTPGGVLYRIVTDQLGSVRMVVNASTGVVTNRYVYDEWGKLDTGSPLDKDSGNEFVPFGFAGGLYDPDTGLIQFGAREYEPTLGRFITADPTLFAGGLNLYAYADGDPINYIDPEGTAAFLVPLLAVAARGFIIDVAIQAATKGCVDYTSAALWGVAGGLGGAFAAVKLVRAVPSAKALGRALEAAGHARPAQSAAHHIVAGSAGAAAPARAVLRKFGIKINSAPNGVFLPKNSLAPNPTGAVVHSGVHTKNYYNAVNQLMSGAKTKQEALAALKHIEQTLLAGPGAVWW